MELKEECPECGKEESLMLESAKGFGFLERVGGYDFYRCMNCGYAYKKIEGEIKEVSEEEAEKITERALR